MPSVEIPPIASTNPTLADAIGLCKLRAGLSKARGADAYVLGNPKSWLGSAYHQVLEHSGGPASDDDAVALAIWNDAIDAQDQRAQRHVLDGRFGRPETWPAYHLTRANALLRVRDSRRPPGAARATTSEAAAAPLRERRFSAFGGKLVGKPDLIRAPDIIDYKTGSVTEHDDATQADVVKAAYVRQLRIYGFLTHESLGWWPQRGLLLPAMGPPVDVPLDAAACEGEAHAAIAGLDAYNAAFASLSAASALASPSPEACKWCPFKLLCSAFWSAVTPASSGKLDGAALEGTVTDVRPVHAGAANAVTLDILRGSEELATANLTPLRPLIHYPHAPIAIGDQVRVVGLWRRPDNTIAPSSRTLLARVADLPTVALRKNDVPAS